MLDKRTGYFSSPEQTKHLCKVTGVRSLTAGARTAPASGAGRFAADARRAVFFAVFFIVFRQCLVSVSVSVPDPDTRH